MRRASVVGGAPLSQRPRCSGSLARRLARSHAQQPGHGDQPHGGSDRESLDAGAGARRGGRRRACRSRTRRTRSPSAQSALKRRADVCRVPRCGGISRRLRSDDRRCTPTVRTWPSGSTSAARSYCDSALSRAAKWARRRRSRGGIGTDACMPSSSSSCGSPSVRHTRRRADTTGGQPVRAQLHQVGQHDGVGVRHVRRDALDERHRQAPWSTSGCRPTSPHRPAWTCAPSPDRGAAPRARASRRRGARRTTRTRGSARSTRADRGRRRGGRRTTTGRRRGGGPWSAGWRRGRRPRAVRTPPCAARRASPAGRRSAGRRPRGRADGGRSRSRRGAAPGGRRRPAARCRRRPARAAAAAAGAAWRRARPAGGHP